MRIRTEVARWVVAAAMLAAGVARAELVIEITKGTVDAMPVAIVPFGWESDDPEYDFARVVEADLERTGRFEPMPRDAMLERPTDGRDVDFGDWRLLGTDAVVVGSVRPAANGGYQVRFQAFDVFRGERIAGYTVEAYPDNLRATGHYIADLVYEALTGEPGAFSTRIAYVAVRRNPDNFALTVADADGENPQVIAESGNPIMSPTWSPDATRIAYVGFEDNMAAIWVQELASGSRRRVSARSGVNGAPAFSPDGHRLAVALSQTDGNVDIHVLNLATGDLRRVTDHPAIDTEPDWTPDGRNIVFTSDRAGGPQIYRVGASGGRPQRLSFEGDYNARPRLSPDGQRVAVVHNDRGRYRIALIDMASGSTQVLTEGRLDESPSFAPNGSMIIYATESGGGVLAAVSVDGRVHQRLASSGGAVREPVWSPFIRR